MEVDWNPEELEQSDIGLSGDDVLYGKLLGADTPRNHLDGLSERVQLPDIPLPGVAARLEDPIELYMVIAATRLLAQGDAEAMIPVSLVINAFKQELPSIFIDPDTQGFDFSTIKFEVITDIFRSYKEQHPKLEGLRLAEYEWDTVFHAMDVYCRRGADPLGHAQAIMRTMHQRICGYDLRRRENHLYCGSCGGTFERSELVGIQTGHWACGECMRNF